MQAKVVPVQAISGENPEWQECPEFSAVLIETDHGVLLVDSPNGEDERLLPTVFALPGGASLALMEAVKMFVECDNDEEPPHHAGEYAELLAEFLRNTP